GRDPGPWDREPGGVHRERGDEFEGASDRPPVPGEGRCAERADLLVGDPRAERAGEPHAELVLADDDVRDGGARLVVVLHGAAAAEPQVSVAAAHAERSGGDLRSVGTDDVPGAEVRIRG